MAHPLQAQIIELRTLSHRIHLARYAGTPISAAMTARMVELTDMVHRYVEPPQFVLTGCRNNHH